MLRSHFPNYDFQKYSKSKFLRNFQSIINDKIHSQKKSNRRAQHLESVRTSCRWRVDGFGSAADHDEVLQANVRRLSLIYNVLIPLYETRGHQEDPNYIRYQLTEDNPSTWESTSQKNCGLMYDTRDTFDATSEYLHDGTYYRTRYAYPWSWYGYEIATTKYLKAYSQIGVR